MKKKIVVFILIVFFFWFVFSIFLSKSYRDVDFNIETYRSSVDKDNDGIEDQADILNSVKEYINTNPKYKSKYYETGYSNDEYGVCTDVVAFGLKGSGYDLMELVNEDIVNNKSEYNIEKVDKKIDFRRVKNLNVYFKRNSINLTTNIKDIASFQGGDIVVFENHIGVLSDKRNKKGIPFLIHHKGPYQMHYEEDVLGYYKIIGHYRVS